MFRNPTTDLIIVLVIVLLIFGPKRLPGLGKHLGTGLREFKDSITGDSQDEERPELTQAAESPPAGNGEPARATAPTESAHASAPGSAGGSEHRA
jgi:sec-independent protein translocase protein TatA